MTLIAGCFGAGAKESAFAGAMNNMLQTLEAVLLSLVIFFVRQAVRKKYAIKPLEGLVCTQCITDMKSKAFVEDILCAFCCECCTIAQMARHIYDYDNTGLECRFNATGDFGELVPVVVPPAAVQLREELGYQQLQAVAVAAPAYEEPAANIAP